MKKQLLAGAASLVMAATPVFGVFAEAPQAGTVDGTFQGTREVKVGEVDETVYSVDIDWGDLSFDWKYDAKTNEFNFKPHFICQTYSNNEGTSSTLENLKTKGKLYSDAECTLPATGELINETYYATEVPDGRIYIKDNTVNGRLKSSASFAPEDEYAWITGEFGKWSLDDNSEYTIFNVFDDENIPTSSDGFGNKIAVAFLNLKKNPNMGTTEPITKNDKIGTVTIDIEPDLN